MENQIDYLEQPSMQCDDPECGNHTFFPVVIFKVISALVSPSGKEEIIPMETYRCSNCGTIPKRFPQ
jgi:hypothetical protein